MKPDQKYFDLAFNFDPGFNLAQDFQIGCLLVNAYNCRIISMAVCCAASGCSILNFIYYICIAFVYSLNV